MSVTIICIVSVVTVLLVPLFLLGYKKAPADVAYVRTGLRKSKTFINQSFFCIPFLETYDKLNLEAFVVNLKPTEPAIPTADCIPITVDAVCMASIDIRDSIIIKVRDKDGNIIEEEVSSLELAKRNFLNKSTDEIKECIMKTLEGNVRSIVSEMTLKEMLNDRKKFDSLAYENAGEDLARVGIKVLTFNVQNFADRNGVIEAMGVDNTERIRKEAAISKANSLKEVKVAEALALKEANEAEVASQTDIAEKQNELVVRKAQLKIESDTQKAKSDAAYEIQKQEQQKAIVVAKTNAEIAQQEREVELKEREAQVKEKELLATVQKQADAELYQKQKSYEADTYKARQEAEARKAEADANLYAKQKEAEGIALVGKAEAEAIQAKGLAEAEALEKKAEAQAKMGKASMLEMYFSALPEVAKAVAEPLQNVDTITMYGDGNSSKMVGDITKSMTQIMSGIEDATGLDVTSMISGFLGGKLSTTSQLPTEPTASTSEGELE